MTTGKATDAPLTGGFPSSGIATTIPSVFFARVMPEIDSPEELAVSVYFFYAQGRVRRTPRFLTRRELAADAALLRSLARLAGGSDHQALDRGLALAARRGTIFSAQVKIDGRDEEVYAVNNPANRRLLGARQPAPIDAPLPPADGTAAPDIFTLYEQNIGNITPLIADDLKDAEERYPPSWIEHAFREAVAANKRSWRYIETILKRWETEGPDHEEPERDSAAEWLARRYTSGKRRTRT